MGTSFGKSIRKILNAVEIKQLSIFEALEVVQTRAFAWGPAFNILLMDDQCYLASVCYVVNR